VNNQIITQVNDIIQSPIYLVGGSVRDHLLGQEPKDYDFTTALLPDEVEARIIASGRKAYTIGKKFGTVGMKIKLDDGKYEYIEITTYRGEEYDQLTKSTLARSRKPTVNFIIDIAQDLSRRDFTINALAMDRNSNIKDYFGGKDDLTNKILRCVGVPKQRFKEDPLRILRAIRFATKYNLEIEPKTWEYVCKMKFELLRVSKERWVIELDKILGFENVKVGLNLLMESGILRVIIPELALQKDYDQNTPWHDFTLWEHTCRVVDNCPNDNLDLRWSALLHDIAKPFTRTENPKGHSNYLNHDILGAEMSLKVSDYLKFSKVRKGFIFETILNHLKVECVLKEFDDGGKKIQNNNLNS
jgi:tRNA nucleotidyltransferase (CCA-adding enzyme)